MKMLGRFKDILSDSKNNSILSLIISDFRSKELIKELDEEKTYSIEIKEVKSKRSLAQNRYMWLLIHEIGLKMYGRATDDEDIYIMCLERANVKFDYIGCLPEAEKTLKQNFRAVKYIKDIDLNGKEGKMYKVFIGSSKMDVKEMTDLIETVLDVAEQVGIETNSYWREVML